MELKIEKIEIVDATGEGDGLFLVTYHYSDGTSAVMYDSPRYFKAWASAIEEARVEQVSHIEDLTLRWGR